MFDLNLNETVFVPVATADTAISVDSPLYTIESVNTTELRIQSVATNTGNEHTVQKSSNESLIATKVPQGEVALLTSIPATGRQTTQRIAGVFLKAQA
ncbi:hypothetical protein R9X47_24405 [Wukongibacter baidiensis]|uniref:hypothetical protein n=1 Tax=Wukongibacter baidiensis TaxID=1723361 RepID=UPI003D7FD87D